jgi:ubiquinone/menaquinone biosynthesis C-methylase UbiE
MHPELVGSICDPATHAPLDLVDAELDARGRIDKGRLVGADGVTYSIRNGIPRFVSSDVSLGTVESFGNQWNFFNFIAFHTHWLQHTVRNTFGSPDAFRGKVIVDAGAGSGAQAVWMLQSGARHVILLELSHAVDGIIRQNLEASGFDNWDIVQCSIDAPPIRPRSADLVMCHNVIQHTPSVEVTAHALFDLVRPGGELVFNCYPLNDQGMWRWLRHHLVYRPLRAVLSRAPFRVNLAYATTMAALRQIPAIGPFLEKSGFCSQGEVLGTDGSVAGIRMRFHATRLNTFDRFGSHRYQHLKRDSEIIALVRSLQPDSSKVHNIEAYFARPSPIGCALRVSR